MQVKSAAVSRPHVGSLPSTQKPAATVSRPPSEDWSSTQVKSAAVMRPHVGTQKPAATVLRPTEALDLPELHHSAEISCLDTLTKLYGS